MSYYIKKWEDLIAEKCAKTDPILCGSKSVKSDPPLCDAKTVLVIPGSKTPQSSHVCYDVGRSDDGETLQDIDVASSSISPSSASTSGSNG